MNISDAYVEIPELIEYSNLIRAPARANTLSTLRSTCPRPTPKWSQPNDELIEEATGYLERMNPAFGRDWVPAKHCCRYEFAQTICPPDFEAILSPMKALVAGFCMANTPRGYPEDRSISESIATARRLTGSAVEDSSV